MTTLLNMDELFKTYTDEAAAKEATAYKTIPTGSYLMKGDTVEPQIGDNEKFAELFGRKYAHFGGFVTTKAGDKKGKQFFNASWEVYRVNPATKKPERITDDNRAQAESEKWPQDRATKLWGMLANAFDMLKKPAAEVLEAFKMYPVSVFVTENFETGEGWKTPKTDEERNGYLRSGYRSVNSVVSIGKVK